MEEAGAGRVAEMSNNEIQVSKDEKKRKTLRFQTRWEDAGFLIVVRVRNWAKKYQPGAECAMLGLPIAGVERLSACV